MSNTVYANTGTDMVSSGGGHVNLTASVTNQANSGTAIPCKVCYITALAASAVHFSINTSTNVSTGAVVPTQESGSIPITPLEVPIDDVAKLWFKSNVAASVNITYRY